MDTLLREPWSTESFLAWEDRQDGRHEFDGETIVLMTGGTRAHQRIVFNLLTLLTAGLPPGWDVVQEMRIRAGAKIRYPDVCVCSAPIPRRQRTLTDAVAILEVLSDETAAIDRTIKLTEYADLPGIRCYVLIEQDSIEATVHRRREGGWDTSVSRGGMLRLDGITELGLDAIYAGLRFGS